MDTRQDLSFDDPALKAAVRKAWGDQQAPDYLRRKVAALAARPAAGARPISWLRSPLFSLAAAAVLLAGMGGFVVYLLHGPRSVEVATSSALPASLAGDLVFRHDECSRAPDHHLPGLPRDNFPAIAAMLRTRLAYPVLSAPLPRPYAFDGASICYVGKIQSAHLLFHEDSRQVSVFSLPANAVPKSPAGAVYEAAAYGHPIVGVVQGRGFYCIVLSGPNATARESRNLLESLRPALQHDANTTTAVAWYRP